MALSVHGLSVMSVWKVSFDFHFKIEMKIEKIVSFDFFSNVEFWMLSPKQCMITIFRLENKFWNH